MNYLSTLALTALLAFTLGGCGKKAAAEGEKPAAKTEKAEGAKAAKADKAAPAAAAGKGLHDSGPVGDAAKGAPIYASKCVACHQKDGKAMGGMLGADFIKDKTRLAKPDSVLLASIRDGKKGKSAVMPPQKDVLTEQEIKDVLAYVRKQFGSK